MKAYKLICTAYKWVCTILQNFQAYKYICTLVNGEKNTYKYICTGDNAVQIVFVRHTNVIYKESYKI